MKRLGLLLWLVVLGVVSINAQNFHSFKYPKINGDTLDFSTLAGKKILVVNTASFCGYTSQYANLQNLYTTYGGNDFEILAFPANNFWGQEPNNEAWIANFVSTTYGVTFTMMSKISVARFNYNGFPADSNNATATSQHEIYQWLTQMSQNGVMNAPVKWNFQKFLIDESGNLVNMVAYNVNPQTSTVITNWLNTTGTEEVSGLNAPLAFPNPFSDRITILCKNDVNEVKVEIYNINGQLLKHVSEIPNGQQITINTKDIAAGVYLLKIFNNSSIITTRIIKQ